MAERLVAIDHRSAESSYLLALCHLRLGDNRSAYEYSKPAGSRGTHLGCAYIFAHACLALERYKDGIVALEKSRGLWGARNSYAKHSQSTRQPYADAAAINCLLGKLYYGYDDKKKAISYFEASLKLNPFMWDAFTHLCDMGTNVRVPNIFKINQEMESILKSSQCDASMSFSSKDGSLLSPIPSDCSQNRTGTRPTVAESNDPFNHQSSKGFTGGLFGTMGLSQKINESNPSISNVSGSGTGLDVVDSPTGPTATIDVSIVQNGHRPGVVSAYPVEPPQAPLRKNRTLQGVGTDFSADGSRLSRPPTSKRSTRNDATLESLVEGATSNRPSGLPTGIGERKRTISGQTVQPRQTSVEDPSGARRSVRLSNQVRAPTKTSSAIATVGPSQGRELKKARPQIARIMRLGTGTSTVGRVVSGNRKPVEEDMGVHPLQTSSNVQVPVKPMQTEIEKQEEALRWLLDMFRKLGEGYFELSRFRCKESLDAYGSLPRTQQDTPWVLAQMGRANFEQAAYADAESYYRKIRAIAPTRFEDMEVYSTILWHLKRETDLSFLAHELIDADWHSPYAWCALGNAWSLVRDHEQALRCFKRATQLNPKFAYAFTLQGHEHVLNEEYDKALSAYRLGMAADKRHYTAYYGIGRVYEKLGSFDKAFTHFAAASSMNPTNAVLLCCIGSVLEKQKKHRLALQYYTKATEIAPRSAGTRFKRARALMAVGDMQAALAELMILRDLAPDEAMVHFLLGKLYKRLGVKQLAVRHFTIALNLDPKVSHIFCPRI